LIKNNLKYIILLLFAYHLEYFINVAHLNHNNRYNTIIIHPTKLTQAINNISMQNKYSHVALSSEISMYLVSGFI
jgi:hypothetical protein